MPAAHEAGGNTPAFRNVFITGGGSGLGAALAQALCRLDWNVAIAGRRADLLQQVADRTGAQAFVLDVTDAAAVEAAIAGFAPDALVCCAAILGQGSVYGDLDAERFAQVHAINVSGTFNACRAAMRLWQERSIHGDIVNISSLGGLRGMQRFPGFAAYASSKHAVIGLTEALAIEGKPYGIRVNAVAPGTMRTAMTQQLGLQPSTTVEDVVPTIEFLLDRARSAPLSGTTVEIHCNDD
jgi:NAD(P)-dependent dehydrogenase (short-subunit alcohol dehydrogenase family)